MFGQQPAYILGFVNLFLACIAIICVVKAEDHPEYFSLVYIAISVFIFYMGTILIIIIVQIIETCQEQHQQQQNQISLEIQIPKLTTQISSQINSIIDESLTIVTKPKINLPRSQTLPLTLSSYNPDPISALSSTLKDFQNVSTQLALLPKYQKKFTTIHKNYQSFTFITNEHRNPSSLYSP